MILLAQAFSNRIYFRCNMLASQVRLVLAIENRMSSPVRPNLRRSINLPLQIISAPPRRIETSAALERTRA